MLILKEYIKEASFSKNGNHVFALDEFYDFNEGQLNCVEVNLGNVPQSEKIQHNWLV